MGIEVHEMIKKHEYSAVSNGAKIDTHDLESDVEEESLPEIANAAKQRFNLTWVYNFLLSSILVGYLIFRSKNQKSMQPMLNPSEPPMSHISSSTFELQNIVMIKGPKVGGSTLGGIVRHIGAHYNLSGFRSDNWISSEPGVWAQHKALDLEFLHEIQSLQMKTFLFTIIREPSARCLSDFYFFQTHGQKQYRDFSDKLQYFRKYCTNRQWRAITGRMQNFTALETYDFIAITERFNESMVILKHLLGLKWRDVMYMSSKISGAQDSWTTKTEKYRPYEEESEVLKQYVNNTWKKINRDFELYRKVEIEFEKKLSRIRNFKEEVSKFETLLDTIQRICHLILSSSKSWKLHEAYFEDMMPGYRCLDQIGDVDSLLNQ